MTTWKNFVSVLIGVLVLVICHAVSVMADPADPCANLRKMLQSRNDQLDRLRDRLIEVEAEGTMRSDPIRLQIKNLGEQIHQTSLELQQCEAEHGPINLKRVPFHTGYFNGTVGLVSSLQVDLMVSYSLNGHTTQDKIDSQIDTLNQISPTRLHAMVQVIVPPYDKAQVEGLVTGLQSRAEIWGWYLADEPDHPSTHVSAEDAISAYKMIKALDSRKRPVAIAFTPTLDAADAYTNAMDIYMVDPYPIDGESKEFQSPSLTSYFETLTNLSYHSHNTLKKPFWPVLQAYRKTKPPCMASDGLCGFPTYKEERYMIYAAIQSGAEGLTFFDLDQDTNESVLEARWADQRLKILLAEFEKYAKSFGDGPVSSIQTQPGIVATLYKNADFESGKSYVLLLVHHGPEDQVATSVTFQDPKIMPRNIIDSVDNTVTPVSGGKFDVKLGPYQVRIYKFGLEP